MMGVKGWKVFVFGFGYSAQEIAKELARRGVEISGTVRSLGKAETLRAKGLRCVLFDDEETVLRELSGASHLLASAPPRDGGDPVLAVYGEAIAAMTSVRWIGYLSTIGVYGDHSGGYVDELTSVAPAGERARLRLAAEDAWRALAAKIGAALDIFRLSGIYGAARNPFERLLDGTAQRVIKPGQVFNRIHVDDIAQTVAAAMTRPAAAPRARVFNVSDDEPAPQADVMTYAAQLIGAPLPPEVPFAEARLSPMALSFWRDNKRVRNDKIKRELHVRLKYPTYREGLAAIARAEREGGRLPAQP